jgi:hypothetical protein
MFHVRARNSKRVSGRNASRFTRQGRQSRTSFITYSQASDSWSVGVTDAHVFRPTSDVQSRAEPGAAYLTTVAPVSARTQDSVVHAATVAFMRRRQSARRDAVIRPAAAERFDAVPCSTAITSFHICALFLHLLANRWAVYRAASALLGCYRRAGSIIHGVVVEW